MFDGLFEEFGNDEVFRKIVEKMADKAIIDINNQLKFKEIDLDDAIVGAILLIVIRNKLGIEFLRTINMVVNGSDEIAYANVNDFFNKLESLYINAENYRDTTLNNEKRYGK